MNRKTHRFLAWPLAALTIAVGACQSDPNKLTDEQKKRLVEIHTESAEQYLNMGEIDRAEGQALKGLALEPDNVHLQLIRGWALQRRGRTADVFAAEQVFRPLLASGDFRATLGLAESLERKGVAYTEAAQAIKSGKRVTEAPDPTQRAHELDGFARKSWEESHAHYTGVLEKHPGDVDAMNGLARVSALLDRKEESLDWASRVIDSVARERVFWEQRVLRPDISADEESHLRGLMSRALDIEVAAHLHSSTVLHSLGRDGEAIAHLDAAVALDPDRPEHYSRRAELSQSVGHYQQAVADVDQFLKLSTLGFDHPDIRRAWRLRSQCQESLRQAELDR